MKHDTYEVITNRIIELLEQGTIPWTKPWSGGSAPRNHISGTIYRGINSIITNCSGFTSPYWLTFNQVRKAKGHVIKGSKGTTIVLWRFIEKKNGDTYSMLKHFSIFNAEQIEGIDFPVIPKTTIDFNPIDQAEALINQYADRPPVRHEQQRAYYSQDDKINMPKKESFVSIDSYYNTLFHELTHSTGHENRLRREGIVNFDGFGNHLYSKEELIAEIGAAFLCSMSGINSTIDQSASYLQSWIKVLKGNKKLLISASSKAQKAVDYMVSVEKERLVA